nr:hypothetical protein BaRGS_013440 [Batillaria attramentaria]
MSVDLEDDTEVMVIKVKEELDGGKQYTVEIHFEGPLTDDLAGLYLSSYKRGNQTVGDGWMADVYETTPKMSTYLLAIIVCDFGFINGTTNKSVEFEVWARRELLNQTQFALYAGMKILDYYGDFFGIDFPLKKQAMVAIPDFAAGAMENWGLITYRETYLTVQEGVTSERTKNLVTLYIAHELAHQWFGNLVTLAWWDDLWLNEGFAEFVEYIGMDMIDKSWKVWEQFVVDSVQYSFVLDQLATSHPLYSPVEAVEDAEQYFDDISYEKGASVIRMIQFCMGEDTFQRGIKRYLQAHSYANANHTDLWNALAAQTEAENKNLDIPSIMNTWTLQMGFPVVHVTRGAGDVMVKQKRFLINPDATDPGTFHSPYGYMWHVPITLTSSEESHFNVTEKDVVWLTEKEKMFTPTVKLADRDDPAGWILANVLQYGYYRVNYDPQNWNALINQLKRGHTLQDFMQEADDLGPAEQALNQALETVEFNLKWYKDSYPKIVQWLNDKGYHEFEGGETAERTLTKEDILLPTDIRPLHYDLSIEPLMYGDDPGKFTFNGTLTMTFNCVKATDQIVLHANELEVDNFILDTTGKTAPAVISSRMEADKQFLIIRLDAQLTAGQNYSVKMDFRGPLDKDLDGLYLSSYKDGNRTVYMATTQFEPVAARKAFPCMDEPQLKATFCTTIVRRTGNIALSNMPVQRSVDLGEDRVADEFETSLPMSTYLVALIVCEFENKTKYTSGHNIRYEVWGRPAVRDQLDFALNLGVDVIDFYEGYFNINFPLPKQSTLMTMKTDTGGDGNNDNDD